MKTKIAFCVTLFALLLAADRPALSQSAKTTSPRQPHGILQSKSLKALLRARSFSATRTVPSEPDSTAAATPRAKVYKFATADYPGSSSNIAFDQSVGTVVGTFQFNAGTASEPSSPLTAFTFKNGLYQIFTVPQLVGKCDHGHQHPRSNGGDLRRSFRRCARLSRFG
jgi:hypothetical protein